MPSPYSQCHDRIKHRFSSRRMRDVVNSLTDKQKGYVKKHGFGKLLDILSFSPLPLMEWVMDHIRIGSSQFVYKNRCIKFTKDVVKQVLGIPSGSLPVALHSVDDNISSAVSKLKSAYCIVGDKPSISTVISVLIGDEVEESFMRSFMLIAISTVLCPSTENFVNLNYLNSLTHIPDLQNFDWAGHILSYILSEVKRYQEKVDAGDMVGGKSLYFGSCLPLLVTVYMGFLDLNGFDGKQYHICYHVPRFCHVCKQDFKIVMDVDRNRSSLGSYCFGQTIL
uniref:Uncharacterized protein n=1 Tax=Arundo donax TaxID=35708 RepID=A0A0A9CZH3_ARUDO